MKSQIGNLIVADSERKFDWGSQSILAGVEDFNEERDGRDGKDFENKESGKKFREYRIFQSGSYFEEEIGI